MKLSVQVVIEMRFDSTPDGKVWSQTTCAFDFWQRYLEVFDEVVVVARVRDVPNIEEGFQRVDGPGVRFIRVPHYIGLGQFLLGFLSIKRTFLWNLNTRNAVIYRIPSVLAEIATRYTRGNRFPFGVEVVGDPFEVFAPGVIHHPFRPLFKWFFKRHVGRFCRRADAVAYVNETVLKKRYPPRASAFVTSYSSVDLPEEAFQIPKRPIKHHGKIKIVLVGSLAQNYKGADVLINAVGKCVKAGHNLELRIVGDGRFKNQLQRQAVALGLDGRVTFVGQLPAGEAVRREMDAGDLFVLPARTEGLPRVVIEAMARSKPCISTTVGGIPELLPAEDLVPPNDIGALTEKIIEVVNDPRRMRNMSERNYKKAREYRKDLLDRRRQVFYTHLRFKTECWLQENGFR